MLVSGARKWEAPTVLRLDQAIATIIRHRRPTPRPSVVQFEPTSLQRGRQQFLNDSTHQRSVLGSEGRR